MNVRARVGGEIPLLGRCCRTRLARPTLTMFCRPALSLLRSGNA